MMTGNELRPLNDEELDHVTGGGSSVAYLAGTLTAILAYGVEMGASLVKQGAKEIVKAV